MSVAAAVKSDPTPDVVSEFNIRGGLPKGSAMRALDAEIAGEGQKVLGKGENIVLSDGSMVAWTPPPAKLVIPDLSEVKSLRHYFGSRGHQVYPAWLYHPTKDAVLVKDSSESAKLGIVFRKATTDEQQRYGAKDVWDWEEGCDWRPQPYVAAKFDPKNPGAGKTVVMGVPDPRIAQNDLVAALIPAVAAAVASSLKATGPAAPAGFDPEQWSAFLEFQAWQKTQEVVAGAAAAIGEAMVEEPPQDGLDLGGAGNALSPEQDRILWEQEASRLGITVDKRWSNATLRDKVEKASAGS